MATIQNFGIPDVGSGILQPKLKNRWRVTFTNLGGGQSSQPVSMQCINFSRPQLSFDKVTTHRYNSRQNIQGKHEWQDISITVEDDVQSSASKIIQEQIQKQQYLTGPEGAWLATAPEGSIYKFAIKADMLDGDENILERWTIQGGWIQNVNYNELDYSSSDAVTISLVISIDHQYQDFLSYQNPGQALGGN